MKRFKHSQFLNSSFIAMLCDTGRLENVRSALGKVTRDDRFMLSRILKSYFDFSRGQKYTPEGSLG